MDNLSQLKGRHNVAMRQVALVEILELQLINRIAHPPRDRTRQRNNCAIDLGHKCES